MVDMEGEALLERELEEAGAVFGIMRGQRIARHFGDPEREYRAAVEGCGVGVLRGNVYLTVDGRSPAEMIQGVITNSVPPPLEPAGPEVLAGQARYATMLTPKGRMITDLWVGWLGASPDSGLLLELPAEGGPAALAHFSRVIPPRLARVTDRTPDFGTLRIMGLEGGDLLSRLGLGFRVEAEDLAGMAEDEIRAVGTHPGAGLRVRRSGDLSVPSWDVVADPPTIRGLWRSMVGGGAVPVGGGVLETLRVEAGRPTFGQDMDDGTIPIEAGLGARAIDDQKGCYTGQEVIVRIRDRGHVNRHLRGLRFGSELAAAPGSELFLGAESGPDSGKRSDPVGLVTSEALSPRVGASIGLGYVRREVPVPGIVHLGSPDGPSVEVRELSGPDWAFG